MDGWPPSGLGIWWYVPYIHSKWRSRQRPLLNSWRVDESTTYGCGRRPTLNCDGVAANEDSDLSDGRNGDDGMNWSDHVRNDDGKSCWWNHDDGGEKGDQNGNCSVVGCSHWSHYAVDLMSCDFGGQCRRCPTCSCCHSSCCLDDSWLHRVRWYVCGHDCRVRCGQLWLAVKRKAMWSVVDLKWYLRPKAICRWRSSFHPK